MSARTTATARCRGWRSQGKPREARRHHGPSIGDFVALDVQRRADLPAGDRTGRRGVHHAQLALCDRDLHAVVAEDSPDRAIHIRAHVVDAVHRVGDPEAHLQAHAVVLEAHQTRHGWRLPQDARMMLRRFEQQLQRHLRVIVVAHHDRQAEAYTLVGVAPVYDRVGDQVLVRDQRLDAVAVAHHDITAAQLLHPTEVLRAGAGVAGEADDVAGLDGLVHQQYEAAHEIARDGLQAEAQAEADGAGQHVERRHVDARGVYAEHDAEADKQEVREFRDADARGDG